MAAGLNSPTVSAQMERLWVSVFFHTFTILVVHLPFHHLITLLPRRVFKLGRALNHLLTGGSNHASVTHHAPVGNLQRSIDFYTHVLGMRLLRRIIRRHCLWPSSATVTSGTIGSSTNL